MARSTLPSEEQQENVMPDKNSKTTVKRNGQGAEKTLGESAKAQRSASTRQAPESTVTGQRQQGEVPANPNRESAITPGS